MQLSVLSASVLALAATAHAHVKGISVPDKIKPGEKFDVIVHGEPYARRAYNIAIVFGWGDGHGDADDLNEVIGSYYLADHQSEETKDFTRKLMVNRKVPKGKGVIRASVMSLYGIHYTPTLHNFNVSVTFADETSSNYVMSE